MESVEPAKNPVPEKVKVKVKTLTLSPSSAEGRPHGTQPLEGALVFAVILRRLLV